VFKPNRTETAKKKDLPCSLPLGLKDVNDARLVHSSSLAASLRTVFSSPAMSSSSKDWLMLHPWKLRLLRRQ
jgi:hypothetical protein